VTISTFDHVLIISKDLERSIKFYRLIGFDHLETINRPNDSVALMRLGDVNIEIMNLPKGKETVREPRKLTDLGFRHIGFKVNDLDAVYKKLKNKIKFDSKPRKIPGRGNRRTVFFKDPDGIELHFVQE
jgi:glyoxylase I family protein